MSCMKESSTCLETTRRTLQLTSTSLPRNGGAAKPPYRRRLLLRDSFGCWVTPFFGCAFFASLWHTSSICSSTALWHCTVHVCASRASLAPQFFWAITSRGKVSHLRYFVLRSHICRNMKICAHSALSLFLCRISSGYYRIIENTPRYMPRRKKKTHFLQSWQRFEGA